jgi:uncharacterized protein (TIGR02328 family)
MIYLTYQIEEVFILRLWHEQLISKLPRPQLLSQHRECAALRGLGWGKPHSVVNYVFKHDYQKLVDYHYLIMREMLKRGYNIHNIDWFNPWYRGKIMGFDSNVKYTPRKYKSNVYVEHNDDYLMECLNNLKRKGIVL